MLQQIPQMSDSKARGLVQHFPTFRSLLTYLNDTAGSKSEKISHLSDKFCNRKESKLASTVYEVFTTLDGQYNLFHEPLKDVSSMRQIKSSSTKDSNGHMADDFDGESVVKVTKKGRKKTAVETVENTANKPDEEIVYNTNTAAIRNVQYLDLCDD